MLKVTDLQPAAVKPLAEVKDQIVDRDPPAAGLGPLLRHGHPAHHAGLRPARQPAAGRRRAGPEAARRPAASRAPACCRRPAGPAPRPPAPTPRCSTIRACARCCSRPEVLRDKHNSGVIELASDTMVAVRVAAITPAHAPPLAGDVQGLDPRAPGRHAARRRGRPGRAGEAALEALQAAAPRHGLGRWLQRRRWTRIAPATRKTCARALASTRSWA